MKRIVIKLVGAVSKRSRTKRAQIFRDNFSVGPDSTILDIGSEDGTNIASVLKETRAKAENIYIADIDWEVVKKGSERYGFIPTVIPESGRLPFEDGFFDVVYCSSVIEHVTVPKTLVWSIRDGPTFRRKSWARQQAFAREIRRVGKRYFVQTPCRSFPVESHTLLPFVGYLPRQVLFPVLRVANRFWIKRTSPDWNLLSVREMRFLFPDAEIVEERFIGLVKSVMAIKK